MASALKAQFEAEAAKQKASPAKPGQPTGVQGLIKQHKNFIEPPPAKGTPHLIKDKEEGVLLTPLRDGRGAVSWKADDNGTTAAAEASHIRYTREGGKPKGPPPKKSLTDLP